MATTAKIAIYKYYNGDLVKGTICSKCKEWKPLKDYGTDASKTLGVRSDCRKCFADMRNKKALAKRTTFRLDELSDEVAEIVRRDLGIKTKGDN